MKLSKLTDNEATRLLNLVKTPGQTLFTKPIDRRLKAKNWVLIGKKQTYVSAGIDRILMNNKNHTWVMNGSAKEDTIIKFWLKNNHDKKILTRKVRYE